MLQKFFLFQFWITFVLTISLKDFAGRCKTRFNSWKKNYHLLLMIFLQALLMKPRRPVNQNKQILVKKISPIWHWFYIFQQNLSKKLLRQMLVRTEKGRTFIKWRTSRKNVHVIIILIITALSPNLNATAPKNSGWKLEQHCSICTDNKTA